MELLVSNIKKFQETETPKKNPYISGNGNPKKSFLYFGEWNFLVRPEKISYISGNKKPEKISYIFLKESFSYISGNGYPEKIIYIAGNGTFLYFKKLFYISGSNFPRSKRKKAS